MKYLRWILFAVCLLSADLSVAGDCEDTKGSEAIPVIGLVAGGPAVSMNVACYFSSVGGATYTVTTAREGVVTASVATGVLTLTPGYAADTAPGLDTVTVSVGNQSVEIGVNVSSCVMATAGPFPRLVVNPNRAHSRDWNMEDYFRRVGTDALTYEASSSDADTFTVELSGTRLTLTGGSLPQGVDKAHAELILTARAGCGAARARLDVTLKPKSPPRVNPDNPVPDTTMMLGDGPVYIWLPPHFIEDDGDQLTYHWPSHSGGNIVSAFRTGLNQDSLMIRLRNTGNTGDVRITYAARDPEGSAYGQFTVTVKGVNRAPVVDPPLSDTTLVLGAREAEITLSDHFSDPDSDDLTYTHRVSTIATTREANVVTAEITSGVLELTAAAAGTATVTVTASDGSLSASDEFVVTVVSNRKPVVSALPDTTLASDGYMSTVTLSDHFSDPDKDKLTYTASSSATGTATVSESAGVLTVTTGGTTGTATITVEASDGSLSVLGSFDVTVTENVAPEVETAMADATLAAGAMHTVTLSGHFRDPDGDDGDLGYSAKSDATGVATVEIEDDSALKVTAVAAGTAEVVVEAEDPGGLTVTDTLDIAVMAAANCTITLSTAFNNVTLQSGGSTHPVTLANHFTVRNCPSGVDYQEESNAAGVARVSESGGTLRVIPGTVSQTSTATITVTASSGTASATGTFVVTVNHVVDPPPPPPPINTAPFVEVSISNQNLKTGGANEPIKLTSHFSDAQDDARDLEYSATVSDAETRTPSVVAVSVNNTTDILTLDPGPDEGSVNVTVRATDTGGLSSVPETFTVTVADNVAPRVKANIGDRTLASGGSALPIPLPSHFEDPDGVDDALEYTATTSSATVATATVTGSGTSSAALTVTPATVTSSSEATITVTAEDPEGATTPHSFTVTVNPGNRAPACDDIDDVPAVNVRSDDVTIDLDDYCSDADSDALTYTLPQNAPSSITLSGSTLTIEPTPVGTITTTVTASDRHGGTATSAVSVTVENLAPETVGTISDVVLAANENSKTVGVASGFSDPESQALTYSADSKDTGVVTTSVSGSTLTLTRVAAGETDVDVTAEDPPGATALQSFGVTVCSNPTASTIPNQTIVRGGASATVSLGSYFTNPNSGSLSYSASRTSGVVISLSIASGVLTISSDAPGPRDTEPVSTTATVTVTATQGGACTGSVTSKAFTVTVRRPPGLSGFIPTQTLQAGGSAVTLDVSSYFTATDDDAITYSVGVTLVRAPDIVSASISGSSLTLTPGTSTGEATVDVTATDTDGSSVQSFTVRVTGDT